MDKTTGCAKTPIADLAIRARKHYEEASTAISHFNSIIPKAIDMWEDHELKAEKAEKLETGNDVEDDFNNFWKDIVCDEDGNLDVEQVKKELFDFHRLMEHSTTVNCHFANLSNFGYEAETIINEGERMIQKRIDEAIEEAESD